MADPAQDRQARNRWLALSLGRLGGVGLTLLGMVILTGRVDMPQAAGWVALGAGLLAAFVLPQLLARRWRSPRS